MNSRRNNHRTGIVLLLAIGLLLNGYAQALAENASPLPPIAPHVKPAADASTGVVNNDQIYNDLLVPQLPIPARNADIADDGQRQEAPGRGVRQLDTGLSSGGTLYAPTNACLDFNHAARWKAQSTATADHYAGWGVYVVNDGWLYQGDKVVVSLESAVGPGNKYGPEQYAIKFASSQPYAAGLGSPLIKAPPGAVVSVSLKYMIFDHDTQGQDYDWVSLGLKPDAEKLTSDAATFVNGHRRGEWTALVHSIAVGQSGKIMILLQAQSPAALNSNIYFDDVQVAINGHYLTDCLYE